VTWSSTTWGAWPGYSVKTITWTSERSGIASRGVLTIAYRPQPITATVARPIRKGLRAEPSMMRRSTDYPASAESGMPCPSWPPASSGMVWPSCCISPLAGMSGPGGRPSPAGMA